MEILQAWERLAERFPIFGQECDFHKFLAVVAKYHHDWRPFSGCGRKMVRVVVTEKGSGKGLQSSVRACACEQGRAPKNNETKALSQFPPTACAWPASTLPTTCSQPCLHFDGPAVSGMHSFHGESTPPTRGRSPQFKEDTGAQRVSDAQITALLMAASEVDLATAHCATTLPAPAIAARRSSGTFSVFNLLSPAPTAETEVSAGMWHHAGWQAAEQTTCGTAQILQKRPARPWDSERPAQTKKKAGAVQDPLHLLLDALTQ
jgi:hypothetical protein